MPLLFVHRTLLCIHNTIPINKIQTFFSLSLSKTDKTFLIKHIRAVTVNENNNNILFITFTSKFLTLSHKKFHMITQFLENTPARPSKSSFTFICPLPYYIVLVAVNAHCLPLYVYNKGIVSHSKTQKKKKYC